MKSSEFFLEEEDPAWSMNGDPWSTSRFHAVLDTGRLDRLRASPQAEIDDIEAAYALAQLAHEELLDYGTGGGQKLEDEGIATVLRTLRAVLKRVTVPFDPPFRDFKGFHGYWSKEGMSGGGGWGARRGYLSELFGPVFSRLDDLADERAASGSIRGVDGMLKNLIFASTGAKPKVIFRDAINNVIEVTENAEYCLFYDRPMGNSGLSWGELTNWWRGAAKLGGQSDQEVARSLYKRLSASMANNGAELMVFRTYCERYKTDQAAALPALLPQVYLHYDPLTWRQRGGKPGVLPRERMDFLLLLPGQVRVVIEVDGKQHYAVKDTASPQLYAEMVAEDRKLRLRGYEVYRFGGFELAQPDAGGPLRTFFDELLARYAS